LSNDLAFEEKYWEVVGLYLHPPHNAVVLCCHEKSQCQALERTPAGLPSDKAISAHAPMIITGTGR
jgi:hypothetical protein